MASFNDDFQTNPSGRWTHLFNSFTWAGNQISTGTGGSYSVYATATGSATQYARVKLLDAQGGGIILRSTGTGSAGFYIADVWSDVLYLQRGDNTGWLVDITNTGLTTAANDVLAVTITGTGTGTTLRAWVNPVNTSPVDASNWDTASDPPDATLTASGGTYYDTGEYVGLGIDNGGIVYDDFYGGSIGAATALTVDRNETATVSDSLTSQLHILERTVTESAVTTDAATATPEVVALDSTVSDSVIVSDQNSLSLGVLDITVAETITTTDCGWHGQYPLQVHAGGRYLVNAQGEPFLLLSDSPQGMAVALAPASYATYFSTRAGQGFNASQVHVIAGDLFGGGGGGTFETYDSIHPFSTDGDISTPNETYFARLDTLVTTAASYGICLFLTAAETINALDLWKTNGTSKCFTWGAYLGNRYKDAQNIVWVVGNDFGVYLTDELARNCLLNVLDGIQSVSSHPIYTAWLDREASRASTHFDAECNLNLGYTYVIAYDQIESEYARTPAEPVFLGETYYENDTIDGLTGTPNIIRRQNYWSFMAGACGTTVHSDNWDFHTGWEDDLLLDSAVEVGYLRALLTAYAWWLLEPDTSNVVMTAGHGTKGDGTEKPPDNDYANCARASDGSLILAYLPTSRQVTIDLTAIDADMALAQWFNPTTGTYSTIGAYATTGTQNFTPDTGDWLLVITASESLAASQSEMVY